MTLQKKEPSPVASRPAPESSTRSAVSGILKTDPTSSPGPMTLQMGWPHGVAFWQGASAGSAARISGLQPLPGFESHAIRFQRRQELFSSRAVAHDLPSCAQRPLCRGSHAQPPCHNWRQRRAMTSSVGPPQPSNEVAFWRRRSGARVASAAQTGAKALVERARVAVRRGYLAISVRISRHGAASRGGSGVRDALFGCSTTARQAFRDAARCRLAAFPGRRQDESLECLSGLLGTVVSRAAS